MIPGSVWSPAGGPAATRRGVLGVRGACARALLSGLGCDREGYTHRPDDPGNGQAQRVRLHGIDVGRGIAGAY